MANWYDELNPSFEVSKISCESTGMDSYLSGDLGFDPLSEWENFEMEDNFSEIADLNDFLGFDLPDEVRVASVKQLGGFVRVANTDTLIRKSERDLWKLKVGEDGEMVIERLFDEDGNPLLA